MSAPVPAPAPIRPLPAPVVDQLRASAALGSLTAVVVGLVANALDARAARVNARLDFARGDCTVDDDGLGIEPREFRPAGGLARLHRAPARPSPARRAR